MQSLPKAHFHSQIKAILQQLVSSTPIGSPPLKSRPPLQPSYNTRNIVEQDRGLKTAGAVLDESRSFFRVHTGYFSNIPKCIKAEFIASWACSQSSVVSSSQR
ncbi:hypothetical protein TNCV_1153581 [Trichonephila clavipes]|nr:hypothetical protein TNCV_1153581 [Trichonephila clavipes]